MSTALALPYPGLRPFEAEDQPLFFGREAQISGMLRQLEDHRFVAVVGSSGSGKSSLVRAGLLPAVHDGFLLGTTDWLTTVIKPGHQPYERLGRALSRAGCGAVTPADDAPLPPEEIAALATLRRTDHGLLTLLDQMAISPESRVIVVVDQFEELFAFRRAGVNRDQVASRDDAAAFVGMLLRSTSEPDGRVWVVLTMRSDFIGDCEAFLGLPEQISRSQFLVPRLDRGQMEEAIRRPASVQGGAFRNFTFDDGLVNRIINDAGDRPDQLPLMQHALMRTWKRAVARAGTDGPVKVMPEDYEAAGGIDMALSLHADAAWDEIRDDPKKADLARRLFLLLCDVSPDGQITRRRPRVAEIQSVTGASVPEIEGIVRVFQQDDRNFLLPPPPQPLGAESFLDISHEALLRQWRRFAEEWQERERRDASELRRLAELADLRRQGQGVGLLSTQDLGRIANWKKRVSAEWACRYVTGEEWDEALRFVEESHSEAERELARERREDERKRENELREKQAEQRRKFLYAVVCILLVATVFSSWQMHRARSAEEEQKKARVEEETARVEAVKAKDEAVKANKDASEAFTKPLLRTIGSSYGTVPTLDERESLWDLATFAAADDKVRKTVIDEWFKEDGELSERAYRREAQGLHAAAGLNEVLQNHSITKANALGKSMAARLKAQTNLVSLSKVGNTLAVLAPSMNRKDATEIATPAIRFLEERLLAVENSAPEPDAKLAVALAGLAVWAQPGDAAKIARRLCTGMKDRSEMSAAGLAGLATALEAFLARMVKTGQTGEVAGLATGAAELLAARLVDSNADATGRPSSLGLALAPLAARIEPTDVESIGIKLGGALKKTEKVTQDALWGLGPALAGVGARMDSRTATTVASNLVEVLKDSGVTERSHVWSLRDALVSLAAQLSAADAGKFGLTLADALKGEPEASYDRLLCLGTALEALVGKMSANDAAAVVTQLTNALEKPTAIPAVRLETLSRAFGAAVAQADPATAATNVVGTLDRVLNQVMNNKPPDYARLACLASAVEALTFQLKPETGQQAANAIVDALEKPGANSADQTYSLTGALVALMEKKKDTNVVVRAAQAVVRALDDSRAADSLILSRLGAALGRLSSLIPSGTQTRLLALSNMLLRPIPGPPKGREIESIDRKQLADLYARLTVEDLAEVLKWPFCVGEAQAMALAELEQKTSKKLKRTIEFGGALREFIKLAQTEKDISVPGKPPTRPKTNSALEELSRL